LVGAVTIDRRRGGRSTRNLRSGDGSASLLVSLWAVALTLVAAAGIVLASALAARAQVAAAADLAALAGASAVLEGTQRACERAGAVADANGATLRRCAVVGAGVRIEVGAPAPPAVDWLLPGRTATLRARAHAELAPASDAN
jgi:secretion/DNA translocation related TadE-like protein